MNKNNNVMAINENENGGYITIDYNDKTTSNITKLFDLSTVKRLNKKNTTDVHKILIEYLEKKFDKFKNNPSYSLQCRDLLINTKAIFEHNENKWFFNNSHLFTVLSIAECIKSFAYRKENPIFLMLEATSKQDDFNLKLSGCKTLEEFENAWSIKKNDKNSVKDSEKNDIENLIENCEKIATAENVGRDEKLKQLNSLESPKTLKQLKTAINKILKSQMKATEKLLVIESLTQDEKKDN